MLMKTVVLCALALAMLAMPALAQEAGGVAAGTPSGVKWGVIGAAFLLGVAAAAGATAQGRATSAAAEGMSRNPGAAKDIRGMTLLGLVLIESLVLYALLICVLIYGR
jgi:F-type H+-transporting ATPase subunit c